MTMAEPSILGRSGRGDLDYPTGPLEITHGHEAQRISANALQGSTRGRQLQRRRRGLADRSSGRLQGRHRNLVKAVLLGRLQLGGEVARHLLVAGGNLGRELVDPLAQRGKVN
jgi:hypothetical protein